VKIPRRKRTWVVGTLTTELILNPSDPHKKVLVLNARVILTFVPFSAVVFLDSERSDECISFTMTCVFFVSVYTIRSRNNA